MKLRSGKMYGDISICINFDEASRAWMKNKVSLSHGLFQYKHC